MKSFITSSLFLSIAICSVSAVAQEGPPANEPAAVHWDAASSQLTLTPHPPSP